MTRSAFLQYFILGIALPVTQVGAQVGHPLVIAHDPVTSLEAERLKTAADLTVKDVGLSGLGQIVFILQNRGAVGINTAERIADKLAGTARNIGGAGRSAKVISTPPIQMDIYLGGTKIQAQYQPGLAGEDARSFVVTLPSNVPVPHCKDVRDIKIVVDPANVVPELHDDNNTAAVTVARPCPDLAVKSIEREKSGIAGETYRVKVTVINLGNAPAPEFQAWGTAVNSFPGPTGWPEMVPMRDIPPLAPGETFVFRPGGDQASFTNTWVKIYLDILHHIDELDETNNLVDKKL
jgi:hypothetical protein